MSDEMIRALGEKVAQARRDFLGYQTCNLPDNEVDRMKMSIATDRAAKELQRAQDDLRRALEAEANPHPSTRRQIAAIHGGWFS